MTENVKGIVEVNCTVDDKGKVEIVITGLSRQEAVKVAEGTLRSNVARAIAEGLGYNGGAECMCPICVARREADSKAGEATNPLTRH